MKFFAYEGGGKDNIKIYRKKPENAYPGAPTKNFA